MRLTERCHLHVKKLTKLGDIVIDATIGNGHDTCFLAGVVGESGLVIGFDIQQEALESTKRNLQENGLEKRALLFQEDHANMLRRVDTHYHGKIKVIMFNLGYLPGGDKTIVTKLSSTITALEISLELLCLGGELVVMVYTGHSGGEEEWHGIQSWLSSLDICYQVQFIVPPSLRKEVPKLFCVKRDK